MKMNEPIGNQIYAALLTRVPLGIYFVVSGLPAIRHPFQMVKVVHDLKILPEPFSTLFGVLLPFVNLVAGAMLLLGTWTTLSAGLLAVMLLPFIYAVGIIDSGFINRDLILLGATLSLLYSGPGALSVDRFRKSG